MAVTKPSIVTTSFLEKISQIFTFAYFATLDRVKKRKEIRVDYTHNKNLT